MDEYKLEFDEDWSYYFGRLPNDLKDRIKKKLIQLKYLPSRHLEHGIDFHVKEIGQYRVVFKTDESLKIRKFYFVGTHKEYEKFIGIRK